MSSGQKKKMVNNKQRIFFSQRETFLHKASQQVLEAGPLEGQLQAHPSGHSIFQRTFIKDLLGFRYVPGARARAEGKTSKAPASKELTF